MPISFDATDPESERARYKVVRRDSFADVHPGSLILAASEVTGTCLFRLASGESQEEYFGPDGIRIVVAAR